MEELRKLCLAYRKHLRTIPQSDLIGIEKLRITDWLLAAQTPRAIKNILTPSRQATLRKNRASDLQRIASICLITLTFPISLPCLIAWSWWVRGTLNFLKPDGAVLVDKLLKLSEAAMVHENTVDEPRSATMQPVLKKENSRVDRFSQQKFFYWEADLLKDTGMPGFLDSRVHPVNGVEQGVLLLDVCYQFKYTEQEPMGKTMSVLLDLSPAPLLSSNPVNAELGEEDAQPWVDWVCHPLRRFGFLKPTFKEMYERAKDESRVYKFSEITVRYQEALPYAQNDTQRIIVLESLINRVGDRYQGCHSSLIRSSALANTVDPIEKAYHMRDVARFERGMEDSLKDIEQALRQLPANYRAITPSILSIQAEYQEIIELIVTERMGEAYLRVSHLKLSDFVKYACPELEAMLHQLKGIFHLLRTDGYWMVLRPNTTARNVQPRILHVEPDDDQLRQHQITIYSKDGAIWGATITDAGAIDRFVIEDSALGEWNEEIFNYLDRFDFYFCDRKDPDDIICPILFKAIAARGYYEKNFLSIPMALRCFERAHEIVSGYDRALAQRMEEVTLGPLREVVNAGKVAKDDTPLAVQKRILAARQAKLGDELRAGTVPQTPKLSTEAWDRILEPTTEPEDTYHPYQMVVYHPRQGV